MFMKIFKCEAAQVWYKIEYKDIEFMELTIIYKMWGTSEWNSIYWNIKYTYCNTGLNSETVFGSLDIYNYLV